MSRFDSNIEPSIKRRRTRRTGAALLAVGLLCVAAGCGGSAGDDEAGAGATQTEQASSPDTGTAADNDGSTDGCAEFPDASDDFPSDPPEVDWDKVDSIAYPVSSTAGPAPGDPTCFAATPTGAVLATAAGVAHLATPRGADYLRDALTGPGTESIMAEQPNMGEVRSAQIAGYRMTPKTCADARCRLDVLVQLNAGDIKVMMHQRFEVRRREGTWKVHVPAGGFADGSITDRRSARSEGYVLW